MKHKTFGGYRVVSLRELLSFIEHHASGSTVELKIVKERPGWSIYKTVEYNGIREDSTTLPVRKVK